MPHKFFFNNEALPPYRNLSEFTERFSKTLTAFKSLTDDESLGITKGIITEKMPSEMAVVEGYSLKDVIGSMNNKALRTLAYAYFKQYPIAPFVDDTNDSVFADFIFSKKDFDLLIKF